MGAGQQGIGDQQIDRSRLDVLDDGDAERFEFLFDLAFAVDARHDRDFMVLHQALGQAQHGDAGAGSIELVIQEENLHAQP